MILFLHHRYRTTGGEERAVEDLMWLVRERLGEDAELLARGPVRRGQAARGLLGGGLGADEVARAVRRTRARVVHAHNLHPTLGWRALAAARDAGARVVLHLHQYRLVCAVGVCFTDGRECTRCHGRNTLPGLLHNCRGSLIEAATYGAALALWQRRIAAQADVFVVPSQFARDRLAVLGAPIADVQVLAPVVRAFARQPTGSTGGPALLVSRLSAEKGIDVGIAACRIAGVKLVVAGEGPAREQLAAAGGDVTFTGQVGQAALAELRRNASVAVAPSRSGETFGLAAAEAMAAGLPVAASRIGALPELVPDEWLVPPDDPAALAGAIGRLRGDPQAGRRAIERAREIAAPEVVAPALAAIYSSSA